MPQDVGTAGTAAPPKAGSGSSQTHVGKTTAVPPKKARLLFDVEVTEEMRAEPTARARHAAILATVFGQPTGPWRAAFDKLPDKKVANITPIGQDVTKLDYWILGSFFLGVADHHAMVPVQMLATDGTKVAIAADYHFAVMAYSDFREQRGRADGLRADYLKDKIAPLLKRLSNAPGGDTDKFRDSYQTAARIAEKLARLDPKALQWLLERELGRGPPPDKIDFSLVNALKALTEHERRIDHLLEASSQRASGFKNLNATLAESIAALEGFQRAWNYDQELQQLRNSSLSEILHLQLAAETVEQIAASLERGTEVPRDLTEQEILQNKRRTALLKAGAHPFFLEADYAGRIETYIHALGKTLPPMATQSLADLRSRVEHALAKPHQEYEALYHRLDELLPDTWVAAEAARRRSKPQFLELEETWPILRYPKLTHRVLYFFTWAKNPSVAVIQTPRHRLFTKSLRYDLDHKFLRQAIKAEAYLRDEPRKTWLAEVLVTEVLGQNGVSKKHFLHSVAMAYSDEVRDDMSILEWVVLILSVALAFVPGGGLVATALRVGVAVLDGYNVYAQQLPDVAGQQALYDIGFSSKEPSHLGLYLAIVAHGVDVVEIGRLMKIPEGRLLDSVKKGEVDALFREYKVSRLKILQAYLKNRRKELGQAAYRKFSEALGGAGAGIVGENFLRREVAGAAALAIRMGITGTRELGAALRLVFGRDIPERLFREALEASKREIAKSEVGRNFNAIFEAFKSSGENARRLREARADINHWLTVRRPPQSGRTLKEAHAAVDAAEEALRTTTHLENALNYRIAHVKRQLATVDEVFSRYTRGTTPAPDNLARRNAFGRQILHQRRELEEEIKLLRTVRGGLPPTKLGRRTFLEQSVTRWVHRAAAPAHDQVRVYVRFADGTETITRVDTLQLVGEARFRIYDAKWSDVGHPPAAARTPKYVRGLLSDAAGDEFSPQRIVYDGLTKGKKVAEARLVDADARRFFFGSADEVEITLENVVFFVLGDRDAWFDMHRLE